MRPSPPPQTVQTVLTRLGYQSFQPGQEEAVSALLDGRDVIAIMPTGGGKSLIYQVAAELVDGLTLVISPLIALMADQAEAAGEQGQAAAVINSHLGEAVISQVLAEAADGRVKLLYVSPERLQNDTFMAWLKDQRVGLAVVDEAHCISEWGHDFRPAYTAIGTALKALGSPLKLALTATATQFVADDIVAQLGLRRPTVIRRGTDRPNLYYEVVPVAHAELKRELLLGTVTGQRDYPAAVREQAVAAAAAGGIIYTATTAAAQEVAGWLSEAGLAAGFYHGQQPKADRERAQAAFMAGEIRVMAATNAFGMGIDKPDVGFVIHYDVPANLESYYQEAGRAGRGGQFAVCSLLYRSEDMGRAAFGGSSDEERQSYERGRQEMMRRYAEEHQCRRAALLNYFGEAFEGPCGTCDADLTEPPADVITIDDPEAEVVKSPYRTGDNVRHKAWGKGVVQAVDEDSITVLFAKAGHKVLSLAVLAEQGVLKVIS